MRWRFYKVHGSGRAVVLFTISTALFSLVLTPPLAAQEKELTSSSRQLIVTSEPSAKVWVDGILFGRTGSDGKLRIAAPSKATHSLRVRADGFKEATRTILPSQSNEISVQLTKTSDPAELAYQEAERQSSRDRDKAIDSYRKAIRLRPGYVWAYIGLARVMSEASDPEGAAKAIRDLRKYSPRNAEASAIEGRTLKDAGEEEKAIAAFKRSITETKGFQPEAYTGLGLLYKERAEGYGGSGSFEQEAANYELSAGYLKTALKQLSGAPDAAVLYQLLGLVYERQKKYSEAIALYREFLSLFPDSNDAPAVSSFIDQLKKLMAAQ